MRWHGHDGTGAIAGQNIVGNPDGNFFVVNRIDGISAGEYASFILGQLGTFQIGFFGDVRLVFCDGIALLRSRDLVNELMLRRKDHVSSSEQCVRASREYFDWIISYNSIKNNACP